MICLWPTFEWEVVFIQLFLVISLPTMTGKPALPDPQRPQGEGWVGPGP